MEKIVVVGASLAGLRAAEELRRHGFGGQITVLSAEDEIFYDRPPLSKQYLAGTFDETRISLIKSDKFDALDLEVVRGPRAFGLDTAGREVLVGEEGRALAYDGLIIATGATPRRIPSFGEMTGLHVIRTRTDAVALRDQITRDGPRFVIIGGGFLGMEVAATARLLGVDVTVVEPLAEPLARVLGDEIGGAIARLHRSEGVDLRTGVGADTIIGTDHVEGLRLSDGTSIPADVVLVAIGVVPATTWLEGSGIDLDNGVVCDSSLRVTSNIAAAGDLVRWHHPLAGAPVRIEHWTNASEQGAHATRSLLSDEPEAFRTVPYFWSDHYDTKIQSIGFPGAEDDVIVVDGSIESGRFVACFARGGKLRGVVSFNRPRQLMAFRPLLDRGASLDEARALEFS